MEAESSVEERDQVPRPGEGIERVARAAIARIEALDSRRASLAVLAMAMAVSAVTLMYFSRGQHFSTDEWLYIGYHPGWSPGSLFHPDNGHLFVLANVVLNASLSLFDTSYVPLRIFSVAMVQINAALVYVIVRRRVGPVMALAPAILLIFLGSSYEIVLQAFSINTLMSIAFGLCAMLALDRGDRRGDLIAGAMLVLSVLSFEWGLFFAAGMAVEMWLRPNRPPLSRFALAAIPFVIWIAWRAWAPSEPSDNITLLNIGTIFSSLGLIAASTLASVTGLFRTPTVFSPTIDPTLGIPLVVVAAIALAVRLRMGPPPTARFYSLATSLFLFWLSVCVTVNAFRGPTTGRYVYGSALLLFLLCAELLRGKRIPRAAYIGVAVVLGFSLVANFVQLRDGGRNVDMINKLNNAKLGAIEIVRGRVPSDLRIEPLQPGQAKQIAFTFTAGRFFEEVDKHGSFGTSPENLVAEGGVSAAVADEELVRALGVEAEPVSAVPPPPAGTRIDSAADLENGVATPAGSCLRIEPSLGRSATAEITLPPGGFSLRSPRYSEVKLSLGRFSTDFPIDLGTLFSSVVVEIPTDSSDRPWSAKIGSARPVTVCPLA